MQLQELGEALADAAKLFLCHVVQVGVLLLVPDAIKGLSLELTPLDHVEHEGLRLHEVVALQAVRVEVALPVVLILAEAVPACRLEVADLSLAYLVYVAIQEHPSVCSLYGGCRIYLRRTAAVPFPYLVDELAGVSVLGSVHLHRVAVVLVALANKCDRIRRHNVNEHIEAGPLVRRRYRLARHTVDAVQQFLETRLRNIVQADLIVAVGVDVEGVLELLVSIEIMLEAVEDARVELVAIAIHSASSAYSG